MQRPHVIAATVSAVLLSAALLQGAPAAEVPVTAAFNDAPTLRIRSDGSEAGSAPYVDSEDCVRSWYNTQKGNFFLRTVSLTAAGCRDSGGVPGGDANAARRIVLDFTDWLGPAPDCGNGLPDGRGNYLNQCGSQAVIDVRVIAAEAFKPGATSTPVTLQFDLYPNFSEGPAFELRFLSRVAIIPAGTSAGAARTMSSVGAPTAQLNTRDPRRPSRMVAVAQYSMPFEVTLTPQP